MIKFLLGLGILFVSSIIFYTLGYIFNKYVIGDNDAKAPMLWVMGMLVTVVICTIIGISYSIGDALIH